MERLSLSRRAASLAILASLGPLAQAQSMAPSDKEMSGIVVSASRSDAKLEEMPLHTTVITQADIQKSPAQTLDQLLRNVPGLNFTGVTAAISDPTGQQTKMRGLGNAKVLVLLDGVPIHDPFYMTTQWFKVPLSNIERVEVLRGGASSLWGNMAVAGVVNIVSKRVKDDAGEVTLGAGNMGTRNVAVNKNFLMSDALSFNVAIDQFQTDGYQQTPAEYLWRFPAKQPIAAKDTNAQITAYFKPNADLNGYLRLGYHLQDQDISYQNGRNLQRSPDISAGLTQKLDTTSSIAANAWAQYVAFDKLNGLTCYFQNNNTCLRYDSSSLTPAQVNANVVQYYSQGGALRYREQGGSLVYSKALKGRWSSFQLGMDYRHLSAQDMERSYGEPTNMARPQGVFKSTDYGEGKQTFIGLFGQVKVFPVDALEVTLSGRSDKAIMSDRANTRTTAAGTTGGPLSDSTTKSFNPSVAARYELTNELALRGAAYKSFRAPGFNNLIRTYGTGTSTTIANPSLEPEKLKGWELGTDYRSGTVDFGATYFLYNIENMITTYKVLASASNIPAQVTAICGPVINAAPNQKFQICDAANVKYYTNDQDGQAHGVELVGRWKVRSDLTLEANFTHTETYLTRHGSQVTDPLGVQLIGVPKNVASLAATWNATSRLRLYANARYTGPMLQDTSTKPPHTFGTGGMTVFDGSANYAWDKSTDVFVAVVNMFDKEYWENTYNYNQPYNRILSMPRAVNVGVKVRF